MWAKVENGEIVKFPYGPHDLAADNPQTSFADKLDPANLVDFGVVVVNEVVPPQYDPINQNLTQGLTVNVLGDWFQVWIVSDATREEIEKRIAENYEKVRQNRSRAYRNESDPMFFKVQRGEASVEEWLAKVEEIKIRYPYPSLQA